MEPDETFSRHDNNYMSLERQGNKMSEIPCQGNKMSEIPCQKAKTFTTPNVNFVAQIYQKCLG